MMDIKHVIVPTDFSDISKQALAFAFELAQKHDAQLDVVHVFEAPTFPSFYGAGALLLYGEVPDMKMQAATALQQLVAPYKEQAGIKLDAHVLEGRAADQICNFAQEAGADLIIIPTYGLTGLSHVLLGSVAERVVRHANTPVLVYKSIGVDSMSKAA
ncbi:MAG: universal stress protein [Bacteroidota bacterium]